MKTALVTGAGRGIGLAIAKRLDRDGFRVALAGRDAERLASAARELEHAPVVLPTDLTIPDAPIDLAERAYAALGRVDVLINNAGAIGVPGPSNAAEARDADALLALNVRAPALLAGRVAARMAQSGGGAIVNVSSAVADRGMPYIGLYSATKGALEALTRSLAAEWGPMGVRVNSVLPGVVATDMTRDLMSDPVVARFYEGSVPLRRAGRPDDVAGVVSFLVGQDAAYVTAAAIVVDGGWSSTGALRPTEASG